MPKEIKKTLKKEINSLKSALKTERDAENFELLNKIETLFRDNINKRNHCTIQDCSSGNLLVYFCKNCNENHLCCTTHFRGRTKTRICPVCDTQGITLRCSHKI